MIKTRPYLLNIDPFLIQYMLIEEDIIYLLTQLLPDQEPETRHFRDLGENRILLVFKKKKKD